MKKMMYVAVCLTALVACSKEQEPIQKNEQFNGSESVLATAKDFVMAGMTKTIITQNGSDAPTFAWKEGDVIGIIPMNNETVQSNYKIAEIGSNPKQAVFDGGVWALKEGKEYAAYYPFKKEALVSNESLEFSFLGQTQTANNSLEHLGAYDYMYASAVVPQSGSAQFDFEHKISLVRLQLTVPNADTYTKVQLESSESWFASGASLKLSDGTMTATETVKSATINLNNIEISTNDVLTVWLATLPTSALSGQTLSIKLFGGENTCTGEISGLTFLSAGSAYSYSSTLSSRGANVEYVDLGLSVKWATCNLGANSPEEYGDYYAWGEIEPKLKYSLDTYKFYKSETIKEGDFEKEYEGFTKYVHQADAVKYGFDGYYDNKTVLDLEDDVVRHHYGGKWRMPTRDEIDELRNNCLHDFVTYKGVKGLRITSKIEGFTDKWIFMPAAGYYYGSSGNNSGYVWSSSLKGQGNSDQAYYLRFSQNEMSINESMEKRYVTLSVRPVSE